MNQTEGSKFDSEKVLSGLKDFQLRTVNYVFNKFYCDEENPTNRFLVADEVGLGKTMVAKGIIAKTLEHLHDKVKRTDIIYVCSNAAIATQNINRLNVSGNQEFGLATRLTMLPTHVKTLAKNKINFISFTPSTTFNLKSRGGLYIERIIIFRMLRNEDWNVGHGLMNMLQGNVQDKVNWRHLAENYSIDIDGEITRKFREKVSNDVKLVHQLECCCHTFQHHNENWPIEDSSKRYDLIGKLRIILADTCIDALKPDLVILDEFQRFNNLLDGNSDASLLAKRLFEFENVRTLLLSATPYKMLSLNHEQDGDHYQDFLRTMGFLFQNDECKIAKLKQNLHEYRKQLFKIDSDAHLNEEIEHLRDSLQNNLLAVMCRTERVGLTEKLDSMLKDLPIKAHMKPSDLHHAAAVDRVVQAVDAPDSTEYWKSSPYLLNFLKNYELRNKIDKVALNPPRTLKEAIRNAESQILKKDHFDNYQEIEPANGRMRVLFEETIDQDMWRLLWLPPSLEYMKPSGVYIDTRNLTKKLVFSKWNAVPDAISAICSYVAELHMIGNKMDSVKHSTLTEQSSQLLPITKGSNGRLTGMPTISLMIPSKILAKEIDPLKIAIEEGECESVSKRKMVNVAESKCRELMQCFPRENAGNSVDTRWYWAAPLILEIKHNTNVLNWLKSSFGRVGHQKDEKHSSSLREHVELLIDIASGNCQKGNPLGPRPDDLPKFLAELSLGGPGICALRSLHRMTPDLKPDNCSLLSAAFKIAEGFRSLFNLPQSIALLQGLSFELLQDSVYWRKTLHYGIDGNIQAILDEQVHILLENLGLSVANDIKRVDGISQNLAESLSIQTAQIKIDELKATENTIKRQSFNTRCRFALRFTEIKDDKEEKLSRIEKVQEAFNSPFWPFILASTSIGQEGLDFHTWCHAVVHWNLPTNPVDLEQREGRVHRYKGHAVRKNIAEYIGLTGLKDWNGKRDPWECLFQLAKANRPDGSSDLIPYWIYEYGSARVERRVPMLPFSREVHQLEDLKKNLALYRLVFGQPRQEDLLAHISGSVSDENMNRIASSVQISLQPPE